MVPGRQARPRPCPGTFREAGVRVQVLLGLLHWDFLYVGFDIDGAAFRRASVVQLLESQRKGSSTKSAAILHTDCSSSGTGEGPAGILCNSNYKLIITQFQRREQLPEGPQNFCQDWLEHNGVCSQVTLNKMWLLADLSATAQINGRKVLEGLLQPLTETIQKQWRQI